MLAEIVHLFDGLFAQSLIRNAQSLSNCLCPCRLKRHRIPLLFEGGSDPGLLVTVGRGQTRSMLVCELVASLLQLGLCVRESRTVFLFGESGLGLERRHGLTQ